MLIKLKHTRNVNQEIAKANPWYVSYQLENLQNPHQVRTIKERWKFIGKIIDKIQNAVHRPLRILDAGCGDGINLAMLTQIPTAEIFAIDYNPIRVERVKENFPDVKISQQDMTNLNMKEKDFDIILCSQVLEHIPNDIDALFQLKNILAPEGILLVGVPNEGCFLARIRNHILEPYISRTTDHVHFYTEKELLKKFKSTGLCILDRLYESFFFPVQSVAGFFASRDWGFRFMGILKNIFPSQTAGYYFALKHCE